MHAWNLLKNFFALSIIFCGVIFSGCQQDRDSSLDASAAPVDIKNADFGTLFLHISELFNLDKEEDNIFVRWEGPVRFYLQGLENHPDLEAMFLKELNEMAKITGLDIKRHDDLYLHYQDSAKAKTGPDGHYTNVTVFFAEDMEKAFQDPKVATVIKGFGDDPHEKYLLWKKHNEESKEPGTLSYEQQGFDVHGMQLFFTLIDISHHLSNLEQFTNKLKLNFIKTNFQLIADVRSSDHIFSVANKEFPLKEKPELTAFDKVFLKVYYSDAVHSGITNRKAALSITDRLAEILAIKKEP